MTGSIKGKLSYYITAYSSKKAELNSIFNSIKAKYKDKCSTFIFSRNQGRSQVRKNPHGRGYPCYDRFIKVSYKGLITHESPAINTEIMTRIAERDIVTEARVA